MQQETITCLFYLVSVVGGHINPTVTFGCSVLLHNVYKRQLTYCILYLKDNLNIENNMHNKKM